MTANTNAQPRRRTRPWAWAALIILIVVVGCIALSWSLCATRDITDNPAINGGFDRGRIFVLQLPVVDRGGYAMREGGDNWIPAGTRLQIIRVDYIQGFVADNIFRAQPLARWLDGPKKGETVFLQGISQRSPDRWTVVDPTYLAPEKSANGTKP